MFFFLSEIVGYIRNKISEVSLPNTQVNQGCICDDTYKLEIRLPLIHNQVICDMPIKLVKKGTFNPKTI